MKKIKHIAFIMDGNGRWAKKRLLPRTLGHAEGVKALKRVVKACVQNDIEYMTFYAFSKENWSRPKEEVDAIFSLITKYIDDTINDLKKENIRLVCIGERSNLPKKVLDAIDRIESIKYDGAIKATVMLAVNYSGQDEIVDAVNKALESGKKKITSDDIKNNLYAPYAPYPDIIVRSSGEERVSNFLIWQLAYSEFIFVNENWPDFDDKTVDKIIDIYSQRDRRFGNIK